MRCWGSSRTLTRSISSLRTTKWRKSIIQTRLAMLLRLWKNLSRFRMRMRCSLTRSCAKSMTDCAWKPNRQVATTVEDHNHKTSRIRIRRDMVRGETLRMTFSMGASRARMISTNIIHSSEGQAGKEMIKMQMKEITTIRVASKISTRHTTSSNKIRIKVGKINNSHTMTTTILLVGQLSIQKTTKKPINKIGSGVSGPQTITKNGEIRPTRRRLTRTSRGDSTSSGLTCSKNMVKTMSLISTRSRKSAIR